MTEANVIPRYTDSSITLTCPIASLVHSVSSSSSSSSSSSVPLSRSTSTFSFYYRLRLAILLLIVTITASRDPSTIATTHSSSSSSSIPTNSTTNILFILADDLGYGDLSVFPYNRLQCSKTPHLQAMADRGVHLIQCDNDDDGHDDDGGLDDLGVCVGGGAKQDNA